MILSVTPNPCVDKTLFTGTLRPGGKNQARAWSAVPGGKGNNVARAVKAMGRESASMPVTGGHSGRHVVDMIEHQDGVRCLPVWIQGATRTIVTVLEEDTGRQTPLFEPGPEVTESEAQGIRDAFAQHAAEADLVTFNGTAPDRTTLLDIYRELGEIAAELNVPVLLDSHGPEFAEGLKAGPAAVKPNLREAEELMGHPLDCLEKRWRAVEHFHDAYRVSLVILSLGAEGALVSRGGERLFLQPPAIEEINAVGSGDALVAGFAIGMTESMPLETMAVLGVAAGTANAMSWDIGHFTMDEVERVAGEVTVSRF